MNIERSSSVRWDNTRRITVAYTGKVKAPPEEVFALLCPVREYDWIDFWKCQMIYSDSGTAEEGCVFTTEHEEDAIWTVSRYEPPSRIAFVIVQPASNVQMLEIEVVATGENVSELTWTRTCTSLNERGDATGEKAIEAFDTKMKGLMRLLDHYCRTGEALSTHGAH